MKTLLTLIFVCVAISFALKAINSSSVAAIEDRNNQTESAINLLRG